MTISDGVNWRAKRFSSVATLARVDENRVQLKRHRPHNGNDEHHDYWPNSKNNWRRVREKGALEEDFI